MSTAAPKNIKELRDFALETLTGLREKRVDLQEGMVVAKMIDTVLGTLKTQGDYNKMLGRGVEIAFLEDPNSSLVFDDRAQEKTKLLTKD